MKTVNINLDRIKVIKFLPKEGVVELQISYSNDGKKEILKTERVVYPESLARRVLAEIRRTVKSAHQKFEDGEILDKYVNVTVENEEEVTKKLTHFLEEIRVNISKVQNMKVAEGYIDSVREVSKMELSLDED
jgi:hypothetical protein